MKNYMKIYTTFCKSNFHISTFSAEEFKFSNKFYLSSPKNIMYLFIFIKFKLFKLNKKLFFFQIASDFITFSIVT